MRFARVRTGGDEPSVHMAFLHGAGSSEVMVKSVSVGETDRQPGIISAAEVSSNPGFSTERDSHLPPSSLTLRRNSSNQAAHRARASLRVRLTQLCSCEPSNCRHASPSTCENPSSTPLRLCLPSKTHPDRDFKPPTPPPAFLECLDVLDLTLGPKRAASYTLINRPDESSAGTPAAQGATGGDPCYPARR